MVKIDWPSNGDKCDSKAEQSECTIQVHRDIQRSVGLRGDANETDSTSYAKSPNILSAIVRVGVTCPGDLLLALASISLPAVSYTLSPRSCPFRVCTSSQVLILRRIAFVEPPFAVAKDLLTSRNLLFGILRFCP